MSNILTLGINSDSIHTIAITTLTPVGLAVIGALALIGIIIGIAISYFCLVPISKHKHLAQFSTITTTRRIINNVIDCLLFIIFIFVGLPFLVFSIILLLVVLAVLFANFYVFVIRMFVNIYHTTMTFL